MKSWRRLASVPIVVLALMSGCSSNDSTSNSRRQNISTIGHLIGPVVDLSLSDHWLVWSSSSKRPKGQRRAGPEASRIDLVIAHARDNSHEYRFSAHGQATSNLAVVSNNFVLSRETIALAKPRCQQRECFTWQLWLLNLENGKGKLVAQSTVPGTEASNPIPVAAPGTFAWQQQDNSGRIVTRVMSADGSMLRTVALSSGSSQISISKGILFADALGDRRLSLHETNLSNGTDLSRRLGKDMFRPWGNAGKLAILDGISGERIRVLVGATTGPLQEIYSSADVYEAIPLPNGTVVWDYLGLHLIQPGQSPEPPRDLLSTARIAINGNEYAYAHETSPGAVAIEIR